MRRATVNVRKRFAGMPVISIHALHEESDHYSQQRKHIERISIHALHEESDFVT